MQALQSAIMTKFASDSPGLYDDLGGRMRFQTARQGETFPYCVYSIIGFGPDHWFGGELQEEITLQFSIFTNESSAVNLNALYTTLTALFDECTLAVSGYDFLRLERNWAYPLRDDENNSWQYTIQYRATIET